MTAVLEQALPALTSHKIQLDPQYVAPVRDSSDALHQVDVLRERMAHDGYLYLPGLLNKQWVLDARRSVVEVLGANDQLDPACVAMDAVYKPGGKHGYNIDISHDDRRFKGQDSAVQRLLYRGEIMEFFTRFLGGVVRHYDFTWFRVCGPGYATNSHCDIVYMGRGTPNVYTTWTPLGDVPLEQGGLMILEGSNRNERLKQTYGKKDVDSYCVNKTGKAALDGWHSKFGGNLSSDPNQIRRSLGGRWVTGEYRTGDVMIFSMFTIHASVDNKSNRIRISTDSRYQLASEPADERWIGENPPGHSKAGKKGRIC